MCNRYKSEFNKLTEEERKRLGLFEEISEIKIRIDLYPDSVALVLTAGMTAQAMRWGMPGPARYGGAPVTNVRNLTSPHWRAWLKPEHRCLVPWTAFSEYEDSSPKGRKVLRWFEPAQARFAMFAGIWTEWEGVRGTKAHPVEGRHRLFAFLTREANDVVRPVHAKAMPVILWSEAEWAHWLAAAPEEVRAVQERPQPEDHLRLLAA